MREKAEQLNKDGNYKEAYDLYRQLALQADDEGRQIASDLTVAVQCLNNLNQLNEIDGLLEQAAQAHAENWLGLLAVAEQYQSIQHNGFIISGEFERGWQRGGNGRAVNSMERDRTCALQLMVQAMPLAEQEENADNTANFYMAFARQILFIRDSNESWRLQYLTSLDELPDYDEGYWYGYRGYGGQAHGAPVDADGNPIYYYVPKSWETAANDGERWRWCLTQAAELNSSMQSSTQWQFADFLQNQFGVQTMAQYSWFRGWGAPSGDEDAVEREGGILSMHTLKENEALARLANGIKRWELPDEFNYIRIYQELNSYNDLANIYRNRRQYPPAAEQLRLWLADNSSGNKESIQQQLDQIVKPWGQFESHAKSPARRGAKVGLRFRNGEKVEFTAHAIDLDAMLADVKKHLESKPNQLDWQRLNINQIAHDILSNPQREKFITDKVTQWSLDLQPLPDHFDRLIEVATPLQNAGAYLLEGRMEGGNTFHTVIWIEDTALLKKRLENEDYYYVCDAVTGQPISGADVEVIAYWQEHLRNNRYRTHLINSALKTDEDGQAFVTKNEVPNQYQSLIVARTPEGRLGFYGFTYGVGGNWYDHEYNQTKTFVITDRPVYRPEHTVKWKIWVRRAQYDQEDKSQFAGQTFNVQIFDPQDTKVLDQEFTADEYGGFDGEYALPKDAKLGVYRVQVAGQGSGIFRVEEYKKPEFEVTVDAPEKPVMLGEAVEAKIQAKYYFGEMVKNAKVKYKVMRTNHNARWYPSMYWDWFYEPGYWWFCYDYPWYPGWGRWGCLAPVPWWYGDRSTPPELVMEDEVEIGEDGAVTIKIDTRIAKEVHGDLDHRYEITAEVTDQSRRTIVGRGSVLVAREPFKVYAWVDRGHYEVGDDVRASFRAQTLDNKPVQGEGELRLYSIAYDKDYKPVESEVQSWSLNTDAQGSAEQQLKASQAGQYRLSYSVTDTEGHTQEGGYIFIVRGEGFDGSQFRFNDLEIVPDKKEYADGDTARMLINTNHPNSVVLFFERPSNGVYRKPQVLRIAGKSAGQTLEISKKDMPNIFVEAVTISDGKIHSQARELHVPPEERMLKLAVEPDKAEYKPREKAKVKLTLTDIDGKPFVGSTVVAVYDKALEYISGGSNVPEIKSFFWKWRRSHSVREESNLLLGFGNLVRDWKEQMQTLGVFGATLQPGDDFVLMDQDGYDSAYAYNGRGDVPLRKPMGVMGLKQQRAAGMSAPMVAMEMKEDAMMDVGLDIEHEETPAPGHGGDADGAAAEPMVRSNFADSVFWGAAITTDEDGTAEIEFDMPDNLTGWKIKSWAMGHGTKVGQAEAEVVTKKNLILRLQAPRFFIEKDEVVLSANVHNYLDDLKHVTGVIELEGDCLELVEVPRFSQPDGIGTMGEPLPLFRMNMKPAGKSQLSDKTQVGIQAQGEQRIDWRVKVLKEGNATIRMKALTDEESDAMEMSFPVYVHGMEKQVPYSGHMKPDVESASITLNVPEERRINDSQLEIRYSPTLAMAMVDALPYMVSYPYGCTEQTLNRFLPTVITQKILMDMGLDLAAIKEKRSNLNAQELGDDKQRAEQWKKEEMRWKRDAEGEWAPNPVFDEEEVKAMVAAGVEKLQAMQLSDGGWGWFSGYHEHSYPHTTAYVVHGLQLALQNDAQVPLGSLGRGVDWLQRYQREQVQELKNWNDDEKKRIKPWKRYADELDAFVFMVLTDANEKNDEMLEFLYRDRNHLAVYAKSMFGIALQKLGETEKRDMIIRNVEQYLVTDEENQTAYLNLGNEGYWWYWYGSEYEAHAYYLKLLAAAKPDSEVAPWLVKYLLNNRKHATYWKSTRDTSVVIEAFADYIRATGEDKPDMTLEVLYDGKKMKEVRINAENLFTYDNKFVLTGDAIETGEHTVEFRKQGSGPLYFNAYLTYFSLEDFITKAGLEIKVDRKTYKLVPEDKQIKVAGSHGQAVDQKVEKFRREELESGAMLKSGDLVEVELTIESKNDYEYLIFEDMKAAGFEAEKVRSGWYSEGGMSAYMELRDEKVAFFTRWLPRGKHSISYRLRAEIPGKFSALPAKGYAMYAPELRANSDEIKLGIED
ncbi:alpha-2-macroglobulin [Candidatus Sumerlaeota bacterium]|nr:alpha-2-macroglobulin [Candidatus Sumerlaeota bacterium]